MGLRVTFGSTTSPTTKKIFFKYFFFFTTTIIINNSNYSVIFYITMHDIVSMQLLLTECTTKYLHVCVFDYLIRCELCLSGAKSLKGGMGRKIQNLLLQRSDAFGCI